MQAEADTLDTMITICHHHRGPASPRLHPFRGGFLHPGGEIPGCLPGLLGYPHPVDDSGSLEHGEERDTSIN
jgi:hypothetical protein